MATIRRCLYVTQLPGSVKILICQSVKMATQLKAVLKQANVFDQI